MKALFLAYINENGYTVDFQTGEVLDDKTIRDYRVCSYKKCEVIAFDEMYHPSNDILSGCHISDYKESDNA
jgi:hypothetical protein